MKKQGGVSLSGLLVWCVILAVGALIGMKVVPAYIEYYKVVKAVKATAQKRPDSVADARNLFAKQAEVDHFDVVQPEDLEVSKETGGMLIGFTYEKRVPLVSNISLVFDFQFSSNGS